MRNKIFGWIGIVWGGLIVLSSLFGATSSGSEAYEAGQSSGAIFGVLLLCAGIYYVRKKNRAEQPDENQDSSETH